MKRLLPLLAAALALLCAGCISLSPATNRNSAEWRPPLPPQLSIQATGDRPLRPDDTVKVAVMPFMSVPAESGGQFERSSVARSVQTIVSPGMAGAFERASATDTTTRPCSSKLIVARTFALASVVGSPSA